MFKDKDLTNIKLIDFGISGQIGNKSLGGTPVYSSPQKLNEKLNHFNFINDDVWSLGISIGVLE